MDDLLHILGGNKIFQELVSQRKSLQVLKANWTDIFGKLSDQVQLEFFRGKSMVLSTSNPIWMGEIRYYKDDILTKVNRVLHPVTGKKTTITDLRIMVEKFAPKGSKEVFISVDEGLSLEATIVRENVLKRGQGWVMCSVCKEVYTSGSVCVFCRSGVK